MKMSTFQIEDLEPVQALIKDGVITLSLSRIRYLCRTGKFPAVKVGAEWKTTRVAARGYFYKGSNKAFRRLVA